MPFVTRLTPPTVPMPWADDKIRFIWSTDEHIINNLTSANAVALGKAVDDCNEWLPNAYISTGDSANTQLYELQRYMSQIWRLRRPFLFCPGNHDLSEYNTNGTGGQLGSPNLDKISEESAWNLPFPWWRSLQLSSGDGTIKARCIFVNTNYYDDDPNGIKISAYHDPDVPLGISTDSPPGGYYVRIPQAHLDWIAAELAADTDSQMALIFTHYTPLPSLQVTNFKALAGVLQVDGRPTIGFSGHLHISADNYPLTTTDGLRTYPFYQLPAMVDSLCWCRVTLGWDGTDIDIDGMVVHNFNQPGALTINLPFTLAA